MNLTLNYYNTYAMQFWNSTFEIDMQHLYAPFLRYIPNHARILDLGCGSGRDTLAFKQMGYLIDAMDYSSALVAKARAVTGINIRLESFYDLSIKEKYDGIWACASLIHCERDQLVTVLTRILAALKNNGICYMSFKYGDQDRQKDGRDFTDLNEYQAKQLLEEFEQAVLLQQWITTDQRTDQTQEWLNIIFQKKDILAVAHTDIQCTAKGEINDL